MTPISSPSLSALKKQMNVPNNLLQDNTNNTTNSPTLMKQGGVPSNETPLSATNNNVGELENKDLNFENICPPPAAAPMNVEEEVVVPSTGEDKEKEHVEEVNTTNTNNFMDDSDDELTEEQKRVIAERISALQNRFKKFEEKSTENKIEELVMQHGHLHLNEKEAFMILKVCEMNELNAEDRLRRVDDLYQDAGESSEMYLLRILDTETGQFLTQIREMVKEEEYAKQTLQKNKKMRTISEQRIARKIKRLSNKKLFDEDGNEIVDSDLEAWEEYDNEQFFEEYVELPPKKEEKVDLGPMLGEDGKEMVIGKDEALDGVKFVRHERKAPNGENLEKGAHTTARLKLDDAVARANAVMEAQMKAREEKRKAKEAKRLAKLAEEEAAKTKEESVKAEQKKEDVGMEETFLEPAAAGEETKPVEETTDATKALSSEAVDATVSGDDTVPPPQATAAVDADANSDDDSDDDIEAPLEIDESELFAGWSEARIKGWKNRIKKPNAYYYRFNAPGERQANGGWTPKEHEQFMDTLAKLPDGKANYEWGTFSISIPGRVGYQCSNYYRSLVKNGVVQDENYMLDDKGELRFNFKNKGFDRTTIGTKPAKVKPPPKPKKPKMRPPPKIKAPKMKKTKKEPKKKKKDEGDDDTKGDKTFRCSVKTGEIRRSSRNSGKEKRKYSDGGEGEDNEDDDNEDDEDGDDEGPPVLPAGFLDPITRMQIEEPAAISPYGHVAGYETWCKILRNPEAPDTCPFTKQNLKRRQLVKLTHENIAEYLDKMVDRVITPTHPTEGDYISLNFEQFLVFLALVFMAYKAFKSFRELKSYLKLLRRPGGEMRVTHRQYNSEEDDDGFGIVLDDDDDRDGDGGGEAKLD
ncbi:unnamed protein product [Bathycoccus prasinos]